MGKPVRKKAFTMLNKKRRSIVIESMEPRLLFDASQLTDTITLSNLPTSISDQTAFHGKVTVEVANDSGTLQKDNLQVFVEMTPDSTYDPGSNDVVGLGVMKGAIKLVDGANKPFKVPVSLFPLASAVVVPVPSLNCQ